MVGGGGAVAVVVVGGGRGGGVVGVEGEGVVVREGVLGGEVVVVLVEVIGVVIG